MFHSFSVCIPPSSHTTHTHTHVQGTHLLSSPPLQLWRMWCSVWDAVDNFFLLLLWALGEPGRWVLPRQREGCFSQRLAEIASMTWARSSKGKSCVVRMQHTITHVHKWTNPPSSPYHHQSHAWHAHPPQTAALTQTTPVLPHRTGTITIVAD